MAKWHNALGEGGQRLTILSLLSPVDLDRAPFDANRELSLREAIDEIFRIAGQDGKANVVLDVTTRDGDGTDFTSEDNVSLQDLAARLYGSLGADGESASMLRILRPGDDPLGEFSDVEDGETSPLGALRRFREAVHHLFGGSAEAGTPPTVLSLLVDPTTARDRLA